jgi:hypothetical protein
MVESSIRGESDEAGGRVANVTFCCGSEVNRRFADGNGAIMTAAACAEYFSMIDKVRDSKALGRMASLARIACCDMSAWFARKCCIRP